MPQDISGVPSVKRRKLQPKSDAVKPVVRKPRNRVEIEYEVETEPKQRERIHKWGICKFVLLFVGHYDCYYRGTILIMDDNNKSYNKNGHGRKDHVRFKKVVHIWSRVEWAFSGDS